MLIPRPDRETVAGRGVLFIGEICMDKLAL